MSQFRKLKQRAQKEHSLKIKRQKAIFSLCFILTIAISFLMLIICAINNAPTLITTVISGCAWLLFDALFGYAIKKKWHILFEECSTGRLSADCEKTEVERKKANWQGNYFKFAISLVVLFIHLVLLFIIIGK